MIDENIIDHFKIQPKSFTSYTLETLEIQKLLKVIEPFDLNYLPLLTIFESHGPQIVVQSHVL